MLTFAFYCLLYSSGTPDFRWLLLGFKREFSFNDSLRVFEILSSHHLELSSLEAETLRRRQQMKEFAEIGK